MSWACSFMTPIYILEVGRNNVNNSKNSYNSNKSTNSNSNNIVIIVVTLLSLGVERSKKISLQ